MQISPIQRNLGFSSTQQEFIRDLKSDEAKKDGVRLSHRKTTFKRDGADYNPERKVCLFLTTDPKGAPARPNVKSGKLEDLYVYGRSFKEAFAKLAKISDGVFVFTKKLKIGK